jgi:hypothetical protein
MSGDNSSKVESSHWPKPYRRSGPHVSPRARHSALRASASAASEVRSTTAFNRVFTISMRRSCDATASGAENSLFRMAPASSVAESLVGVPGMTCLFQRRHCPLPMIVQLPLNAIFCVRRHRKYFEV